MDKTLNPAPLGLAALMDTEETPAAQYEELEIVIAGPDGVEVTVESETAPAAFGDNLAETMDETERTKLSRELLEQVDADILARKEWVDMYVKGLEVLGMKYDERTEPWKGACGVYSTVLTEAAVRFQSETIIETFPAAGPVKTEIIGESTKAAEEAAERVRADMNYRLTEQMGEYRMEHERMLYSLGLAGTAFKKVYKDPALGRQTSVFCPAEDILIPYGGTGVATSERVTHVMRKTENEVKKLQVSGFYRDVDLGEPTATWTDIEKKKAEDQGFTLTEDDRYQLLEVCADLVLDSDPDEQGLARPYVVTLDRASGEVLAVRRNWVEGDALKLRRQHFVQYTYVVGFGAYGLGLINLIGGYARAGTSLIRQLVDAGTLSNLPGGLKSRGLRIKGDDTPIGPGEFRDVDVPSGAVRDNIMPLPYKEPSQVLLALLNQITDEGRRLGSIADMNVSDTSANSPVGTTLALLERQLKTMSAVQARVHAAMKQEFKLLKELIANDPDTTYDYVPTGATQAAKAADYAITNVIPVSDPNSSTMAQRILQYQAVQQLSATAPQIYDLPYLHRQMITVLGVKNADKIVPIADDMEPRDPVSENMAVLVGKPVKAFIEQDHDAHIAVHTSMMQDPLVMSQLGQTPQAQAIQAALMTHVYEHIAFQYRMKVQEQLGATLPPPNAKLPPEIEAPLSKVVAQAAVQLMTINKAQAAQQQIQQQMQDPMLQMQQQEVQIKAQEANTRARKVDADIMLAEKELMLKAQAQGQKLPESPAMVAQQFAQTQGQAQQAHQQKLVQQEQAHQQKLVQKEQLHRQQVAQKQAAAAAGKGAA